MLSILQFLELSCEKNSSSLAFCFGFDDIGSGFAFGFGLVVFTELCVLLGEHPSEWEKIIIIRVVLFHVGEVYA